MLKRKRIHLEVAVFGIIVLLDLGLFQVYMHQLSNIRNQLEVNTISVDGKQISNEPSKEMVVALTFDDGPHCSCTWKLLQGLKERGIKATFFVVGCNIAGKEEILRQMAADGHLIGCHTWNHVQLTKLPLDTAREEIEKCRRQIEQITGQKVEYIRPPFGSWNNALGEIDPSLDVVLWSVDPYDWREQNADLVSERILKEVKSGSIILLHDIYPTSVEAAFRVVDVLKERGYRFVTVNELCVD